ncbi:hypothetical protein FE697_010555 [Mumia zhuanghuii]|uniref:Fluoride ion transporter CrcB n=2 Tax=Mumia TaxID=1546255 RepID=A0ABW1QHN9_9ACTN|nr:MULTISPECIES: hypothetical protein [Mumia]KAA1422624.1 hypothetical protein FE697_010555 [Mumia zhuanghuii]
MRALARAVLVGVLCGGLARALMRAVALLTGAEPAFTWSGTVAIAALFVVASVGTAVAGMLRVHLAIRLLVAAASSGLLIVAGIGIGSSEIAFAAEHGEPGSMVWAVVIAAAIAGLVVAAIVVPWRDASRRRRVPQQRARVLVEA